MTPDVFLARFEEARRIQRKIVSVKLIDMRYGVPMIELSTGVSCYSFNTALGVVWRPKRKT